MSWRFSFIIIAAAVCAAIIALASSTPAPEPAVQDSALPLAPQAFFPVASTTPAPAPVKKTATIKKPPAKPAQQVATQTPASSFEQVSRIKNPYSFGPFSGETLNIMMRAALVNILCTVNSDRSVSGSGILIDPRGVVLTNAHIGQYILLSEASKDITCVVRTGSPAKQAWKTRILYISPEWVHAHAADVHSEQPTGTGENDYALLVLAPLEDNSPAISALTYDPREGVIFEGDSVILGSYPAGFIGSFIVQNDLYPATTFSSVGKLYTFKENTVDLLSLGGVILAQGGSSGGGVVNMWGRLVGLIVTTSAGDTTAKRDLRAITLGHIDRSMRSEFSMGLSQFLDDNLLEHANDFRVTYLTALAQELAAQIPHQ